MKNHQPGAAGLADGPGQAGPALGTIPRRWLHLGRPVISQRIQCEHGPCRRDGRRRAAGAGPTVRAFGETRTSWCLT